MTRKTQGIFDESSKECLHLKEPIPAKEKLCKLKVLTIIMNALMRGYCDQSTSRGTLRKENTKTKYIIFTILISIFANENAKEQYLHSSVLLVFDDWCVGNLVIFTMKERE